MPGLWQPCIWDLSTACFSQAKTKVVVVGVVFAGSQPMRYLAECGPPDSDITIIEKNVSLSHCPQYSGTEAVIRSLSQLDTHEYAHFSRQVDSIYPVGSEAVGCMTNDN